MRSAIITATAIALLATGARGQTCADGKVPPCPPFINGTTCINLPDNTDYEGPWPICPRATPTTPELDRALEICRAHETRLIVDGIDTGGYEFGPKWTKACFAVFEKKSDRDAEQEARDLEFVNRVANGG